MIVWLPTGNGAARRERGDAAGVERGRADEQRAAIVVEVDRSLRRGGARETGATVAVKLSGWPYTVLAGGVSVVVVLSATTFCGWA